MTYISAALQRLATATRVVDVLDIACQVFDDILAVLRRHQEDAVSAFPAFVLAACAAANGRDATGGEWAQPADAWDQDPASHLMNGATVPEVAAAVAAASGELAARLLACAATAANEAERASCEHAAAEAATIRALMGGASPP